MGVFQGTGEIRNKMLHERKNKERVSILKGINKKTYHVLVHSQLVVPFQQFYFRMYWCWRRHLRVPWTARRSNQSILKEISREYSLEGLKLKLAKVNTLAT